MTLSPTNESVLENSTVKVINEVGDDTSVFYTVPAGRMFTGYIRTSNVVSYPILVNGVTWRQTEDSDRNLRELTFGPGTTFTNFTTSSNSYVYGLERDLV
jgi:hypothetical protein